VLGHTDPEREDDALLHEDQPDGRMFMCGDLGDNCAECGWVGDYLCDFPVGEGKTCDRPLCETHANEIAPTCTTVQRIWACGKPTGTAAGCSASWTTWCRSVGLT